MAAAAASTSTSLPLNVPALAGSTELFITALAGAYTTYRPVELANESIYDDVEVPDFGPAEVLGRQRPIPQEKDLSDEAFARRHRFPEVLEKRSKRRERERLVHERFKLKTTLDRLRASDNLPSLLPPSTLPATATHHEKVRETERLRVTMLAEAEETLKRYDELLEPRGVTATEKSRRRPPTQRDAPPAVQAPSKAKGKAATESFTITFKRDTQGQLGATSRSRSSSVPPERTKRARATSVQLLSDSDISDAEERPAKRKRRAIVDTFFESDALRQTIFPASGARRRQSGRIQWAFGVKTPDALLHSGEDFDYLVNPLLSEMGREPHPLEPVA